MRWNILVSFTESRSIEKLDHGWKSNSLSFTDIKYTPGGVCLSKVHPLVIPPHWGHLFNQHLDQETEPEFEASSPAIQYLSHPRKPGPHSNAKVNWASLHTLLEGECATCAACCPPLSLSFMFVTFSHMVLSSFNCLFCHMIFHYSSASVSLVRGLVPGPYSQGWFPNPQRLKSLI